MLEQHDAERERWQVRLLDGSTKLLKESNLKLNNEKADAEDQMRKDISKLQQQMKETADEILRQPRHRRHG